MLRAAVAVLALALPATAFAQAGPPEGAMSLSEIVAKVEADLGADLAYIDEVSWDSSGHYEVEYYTTDNREVSVDIDPSTGDPIQR